MKCYCPKCHISINIGSNLKNVQFKCACGYDLGNLIKNTGSEEIFGESLIAMFKNKDFKAAYTYLSILYGRYKGVIPYPASSRQLNYKDDCCILYTYLLLLWAGFIMSHKKHTLDHIITIIKNEKSIQFDEQKANDIKSDHPSDDIAVLLIDFIRNSLGHACIEYSFKRHGDHDGTLLKRIQDFIVEYENYGLDLDQYREERRERDGVDPSMLDIEVEDTTREIVSDVGSSHDIEHSYHTIHRGSKILRRDDLSDDYDDRLHFDDYYEDYEDTAVDYGYLEDSDYEE